LVVAETDAADDRDSVEYLKGSPRVALDIPTPFSRYVFIERDPDRLHELEVLKAEYGDSRAIVIQPGDANQTIEALILNGRIDWKVHRGIIFLDPFGMQVPWSTLEMLARTQAVEVMINFPVGMAIQRLLARSGVIAPGRQAALDFYLGTSECAS
jgi:three-Cys-motif partner protein